MKRCKNLSKSNFSYRVWKRISLWKKITVYHCSYRKFEKIFNREPPTPINYNFPTWQKSELSDSRDTSLIFK